jgi:hypothetical protein
VLVDLSAQEAVHRVYVLAGPALLLESVDDDPTNDSYTNSSPALNAGVGLALGNLPLDLRGEFTLPLDSENSDGWGVLSLGYRF